MEPELRFNMYDTGDTRQFEKATNPLCIEGYATGIAIDTTLTLCMTCLLQYLKLLSARTCA